MTRRQLQKEAPVYSLRDLHVQYHEHDVARGPEQRMRVWRSDWFHDQFEVIRRDKLRDIFHGVSLCGFSVRYVGNDSREIYDLVHPQVIVGKPNCEEE